MALVLMLSPMTPHIAEELWEMLGIPGRASPAKNGRVYREDLTREEQIEVIIQINGRLRGKILVEDESERRGDARTRADTIRASQRCSTARRSLKTIVVPKKLVNIVLK